MDWNLYRDFLLKNLPGAKVASGGTQIVARCPECGDSRNPKSAHMYISIPYDNTKPSLYYCHKCSSSGVVNHNTLIKWGLFDSDIALNINQYLNELKIKQPENKYLKPSTYKIRHSYITMNDESERKRQYVCSRIGYDLSFDDLINLKISLNLIDLLEENNVHRLTRDRRIVDELDKYFIGFISIDNAFLNMRRTVDEGIVNSSIDKRYINYKIFDKDITSERFYTIPTKIDLSTNQRIKLNIAEGPFDILSVYLNLRNKEEGIYTAVAGNNYFNIIMHFLINMQLPYVELHFYTDNDKYGGLNRIQKIINLIPDKSIPVYIHKNLYEGEKDFGVPKNRIQESIMKLR